MTYFKILDWDSSFFGFKVASINLPLLSEDDIEYCCVKMDEQLVKLAYWKTINEITQLPKNRNISLVDIACIFSINLPIEVIPPSKNISFYSNSFVSQELANIAIQCGIFSRFNIDTNFPQGTCEKMYKIWIENSVTNQLADDIIIYTNRGKIVGLITVYVKNKIGHIGLFGVEESMRGYGVGKNLIYSAMQYFIEKKCISAQVITQINNIAACNIYTKCGFSLFEKKYCYHVWL